MNMHDSSFYCIIISFSFDDVKAMLANLLTACRMVMADAEVPELAGKVEKGEAGEGEKATCPERKSHLH